jgi:hypothetical protein
MSLIFKVILSVLCLASFGLGAETCSRVATINYQEVLVDVSSSNRGEGLRYYLAKDAVAKELLDEYQHNNRPTLGNAAMSTFGTAMIIGGLLRGPEGRDDTLTSRNFLLIGGATLIAVSYLIAKTNQYNNEYLLSKSVEEYNKRNTPRIFFTPTVSPRDGVGAGFGIGQEF